MKNAIYLAILFVSFNATCHDQPKVVPLIEGKLYANVEQEPTFALGEDSLWSFVRNNLKYPYRSNLYQVQGDVKVEFIINEKGYLTDISVRQGVCSELDAEALRVVKLFPRFKPGKCNGKAVKVETFITIPFILKNAISADSTAIADEDFFTLFEKIKKTGDYALQYKTAMAYVDKRNYVAARSYLRLACEKHYPPALTQLGYLFAKGTSVAQSYDSALICFTEAAEAGDDDAQIELGYMYGKGWGVNTSKALAMQWYEKAAQQNNRSALANLGYYCAEGIGRAKSDSLARYYYYRAAELGLARAQHQIGLYMEYGRCGYAADTDMAFIWYFRAVEQHYAPAQSKMGDYYTFGKGSVSKNDTLGNAFYVLAAKQGDAYAQFHVAYNYQTGGGGFAPDTDQALIWYDKSAKQHNSNSLNNYAWLCYLKKKNLETAIDYVKEALQSAPNNINRLDTYASLLFLNGRYEDAKKWEKKAIDGGGEKKGEYMERYGDILMKLNEKEESIKYWKMAQQLKDHSNLLSDKISKGQYLE